jgi:hypothetical protein
MGTLSILYNRIQNTNFICNLNQCGELPIVMEDKYFDKRVLSKIIKVLNLSQADITDIDAFELISSLLNISFSNLINKYIEQHHYSIKATNISM